MCRCSLLMQLIVHLFDIDALLNLADILLDAILERFYVFDVVLVLLHLLLVDFKLAIHDVDVHLVNLDTFAEPDDFDMLDVHLVVGAVVE